MRRSTWLPLALLLACDGGETRSTDEPRCTTGYLDDGGTCVPEACGTGSWGNLEMDEATVYVSAGAEGGDGTPHAPYGSIQLGLDAAGAASGGLVAVAAGTYPEALTLGSQHAGVHLAGRCRELVVVDASTAHLGVPGLAIGVGTAAAEVSGLTVRGSTDEGVDVQGGVVTLRRLRVEENGWTGVRARPIGVQTITLEVVDCLLTDNHVFGTAIYEPESVVTVRDSTIQRTYALDEDIIGTGARATAGASLFMEGCVVAETQGHGLIIDGAGSHATLRDTVVRHAYADGVPGMGHGVLVHDGASLTAERCVIEDNTTVGLMAYQEDTQVTLIDSIVRGTRLDASGTWAYGLAAWEGASLQATGCRLSDQRIGASAWTGAAMALEDCRVTDNRGLGVWCQDAGSRMNLLDTTIRDTQPTDSGDMGYGIEVALDGELYAEGVTLSGNTSLSVVLKPSGHATLVGTTVRDTRISPTTGQAYGIQAEDGSALTARDCVLSGHSTVGLVAVGDGTRITLEGTRIEGTELGPGGLVGYGIEISSGATLEATGCEIRGNTVGGLTAGHGATVSLRDSWISETRQGGGYLGAVGLIAQQGAQLAIAGSTMAANEGPGLVGAVEGTRLSVTGCRIVDNRFAGVVASGAYMLLEASTIQGTTSHPDLGGGYGLYVFPDDDANSTTLVLRDCAVQDNPIAGVWIDGPGSYQLIGNDIHGGEGWTRDTLTKCGDAVFARAGVGAWDGSFGLLLEGNHLADGLTAGLFLDEASATLRDNSYANNGIDLIRQGEACDTPPEGFQDDPIALAELCPGYDYGTCVDTYTVVMELPELADARSRAVLQPHLPPVPVQPALAPPRLPPPRLPLHAGP